MSKKINIDISIDEFIGLLKNSSLPTVIVEGKDDMIVYRTIEEQLSHLGISVLPVGGRTKVLGIYERLNELRKNSRCIFVVDQDCWIFSNIPEKYISEKIITTDGYSIENDIFQDGSLENLLKGSEKDKFNTELDKVISWFSIAVSRNINGENSELKYHPEYVLNPQNYPELIKLKDTESSPSILQNEIKREYRKKLRGKTLLNLLIRNTNYKGREPKHTDSALLESVAIRPGKLLTRIKKEIEEKI